MRKASHTAPATPNAPRNAAKARYSPIVKRPCARTRTPSVSLASTPVLKSKTSLQRFPAACMRTTETSAISALGMSIVRAACA